MKSATNVLGVYPGHNANATLISDQGNILFAMEEARFSRVKDQSGIPHRLLKYIRSNFSDDFLPVTVRDPKYKRISRDIDFSLRSLSKGLAPPNWANLRQGYFKRLVHGRKVEVESREKAPWLMSAKHSIQNVSHHEAHAASAYYCSGFTEGPVMTLDGQGDDRLACTFSWGSKNKLTPLNNIYFNEAPVGYNFQIVTTMLGFHGGRHAGKLTGLASHGEYNSECIELLKHFLDENWKKKAPKNWLNFPSFLIFSPQGKEELFRVRSTIFKKYSMTEMACAIQAITEKTTLDLIQKNLGPPPYPSLALAGGVFGNVKLNQKIKDLGVGKIFIQPAMGDEGLSLGAAYKTAASLGIGKSQPLKSVFLGPEYSISEIEKAIAVSGLHADKYDTVEEKIAELLAEGNVVARFDGRMEYGPRALGNRSILFHTLDKTVNTWLNERFNRTEFMPFAPVTLREDAEKCYESLEGAFHAARFMTITFPCTSLMKRTSPAVVHVDGTARPQIISKEDNPGFYSLLSHYKKLTGIPSLINTSFNMHEEPIVCTPDDAIRAFVKGNLDYLALGPYILKSNTIR